MNAGKLNRQITIQTPGSTQNSYGEQVVTWTDYSANVWAFIEPLNGRELFAAQQVQANLDTRMTMRYISGVKPDMRVVYNSLNYNILNVIDLQERHVEMQLLCSRVST